MPEVTQGGEIASAPDATALPFAAPQARVANPVANASDPDEAALEQAIATVTRAMATADDDTVSDLVAERKAMRAELEALRRAAAGNVVPISGQRRGRRS